MSKQQTATVSIPNSGWPQSQSASQGPKISPNQPRIQNPRCHRPSNWRYGSLGLNQNEGLPSQPIIWEFPKKKREVLELLRKIHQQKTPSRILKMKKITGTIIEDPGSFLLYPCATENFKMLLDLYCGEGGGFNPETLKLGGLDSGKEHDVRQWSETTHPYIASPMLYEENPNLTHPYSKPNVSTQTMKKPQGLAIQHRVSSKYNPPRVYVETKFCCQGLRKSQKISGGSPIIAWGIPRNVTKNQQRQNEMSQNSTIKFWAGWRDTRTYILNFIMNLEQ